MTRESDETPIDGRVDEILADYLVRVDHGEIIDREDLIRQHPDVADQLRAYFANSDVVQHALECDRGAPVTVATVPRPRALRVRCPHCHHPIEIVDTFDTFADLSCPSCGSGFTLISGQPTAGDTSGTRRRISHFELIEKVGMGSFGSVWKARDMQLDRTVAVKIPRGGQLDDTETDLFLREARLAAQVRHPNIVGVHEAGRDGETAYIVSDFIAGVSLKEWLAEQRLADREAAELFVKIADALHAAHEAGLVHRDLKPGNILLDASGEPHITDFGLAKREAAEISIALDGSPLGTPAYMPPEQAWGRGHESDRRSDVYSLGVILFELLTAELPFRGDSQMLIVQIKRDEPPSPRKLNGQIAKDLETITLKCLQKDPGRRYQTAAEAADDMRRFLAMCPILARPITRWERGFRWANRNPTVAWLSASVALLILSVAIGSPIVALRETELRELAEQESRRAAQEALRAKEAAAKETRLRSELQESEQDLWRQLYHADMQNSVEAKGKGNITLVREILERYLPRPEKEDLRGFEWYHLWWWTQQHSRSFATQVPNSGVALTQDGRIAAAADYNSQIRIWEVDTGRFLATLRTPHTGRGICSLSFSSDSRMLVAGSSGPDDDTFRVWDWEAERIRYDVRGQPSQLEAVTCSPDGRLIAAAGEASGVRVYRLKDGTLWKTLAPTKPVRLSSSGGLIFSPDSNSIAITQGKEISVFALDRGELSQSLAGHEADVSALAFSTDGTMIASGDDRGLIIVRRVDDGEEIAHLRRHTKPIRGLSFRGGGQTLYSVSADNSLITWDIANRTPRVVLNAHAQLVDRMASSLDASVLLTCSSEPVVKIWRPESFRTDEIRTGRQHTRYQPMEFFPDSQTLLAASAADHLEIWDVAEGRKRPFPERSHEKLTCLAISPTGECFASGGLDQQVVLWDLHSATPLHVLDSLDAAVNDVCFSHDGKNLAVGLDNGTVIVWDQRSRKRVVTRRDVLSVRSLAFARDDAGLLAATDHFCFSKWNVASDAFLGVLGRVHSETTRVAVSPADGHFVLAGLNDLVLGREGTGADAWRTLKGHATPVRGVAFSPDGRYVVSASDDGSVCLWDVAAASHRATFSCGTPVCDVAFSADGNVLAASTAGGIIRLWYAADEQDVRATQSLDPKWPSGQPATAGPASYGSITPSDASTEEVLRMAIASCESVVSTPEGARQYRRALLTAYRDLSMLLAAQGGWNDSDKQLHRRLQLMDQLLEHRPISPEDKTAFGNVYDGFCFSLRRAGRFQDAAECAHRAVELRQELLEDTPTLPDAQASLAWSMTELGAALSGLKEYPESEAALREALAIWEKALIGSPENVVWQDQCANALISLGNVLMGRGRPNNAREYYSQALDTLETLIEKSPTSLSEEKFRGRSKYCRSRLDEIQKGPQPAATQ